MRGLSIEIDGRAIGPDQPPYVIAELSANHDGSLDKACRLIDAAKEAGVDAVKLQTYRGDTITMDVDRPEFHITKGPRAGQTLFELYEKASTPWDWHAPLFDYARKAGLTIFSSPFDPSAVELLESLGAPAYKVASPELVDLPLIRRMAETGKSLIISTGLASLDEIHEAVDAAREAGCDGIVVLHCVSGYPTPPADSNLRTIQDLAAQTGTLVGLSDHTLGIETSIAAVALGACVIEKHFTLSRAEEGVDAAFSLEPEEFAGLVNSTRTAWEALGRVDYGIKPSEAYTQRLRRSLYAVRDIAAGEVLSADNVRSIRPNNGLPAKELPRVLGRAAKTAIARGTPLSWDLIEAENP